MLMSALGFGGVVGNAVNQVMFGIMGIMFYALSVFLLLMVLIILSRMPAGRKFFKLLSLILLFALVCGFIQYVTEGTIPGNSLLDYYDRSALLHTGGGLVGGVICATTSTAFGETGGLIVTVLFILVCVIELTQKSFSDFIAAVIGGIVNMVEISRERYAEREPERELRREIRNSERERIREEKMALRMERLEERRAKLDEPWDDEFDDDEYDEPMNDEFDDEYDEPGDDEFDDEYNEHWDDEFDDDKYEARQSGRPREPWEDEPGEPWDDEFDDGPVIGDGKKKGKKKNPKVGKFPGNKPELDVPIFESEKESPEMKKARKAINKQQGRPEGQGGFLDGTWLRGTEPSVPAEKKNSPEMREIRDTVTIEHGDDEISPAGSDEIIPDEMIPDEVIPDEEWDGKRNPSIKKEESHRSSENAETSGEDGAASRRSPQRKPRQSQQTAEAQVDSIQEQIASQPEPPKEYIFPPIRLLKKGAGGKKGDSDAYLRATAQKLQDTLYNFGVNATVTNVSRGPTVTRFELTPDMGVKVSKIVSLADDIKLNLACADIRIEAPIPGKSAVGIEVPNKEVTPVMLRELLESEEFRSSSSRLSFAVGKDIGGKPVVADIAKMPHVLIAGATGSGKSVCINTLIMSILYKAKPDEVKMIMIDPKVVELNVYNGIPHLFIPVVTDPKKAAGALNWAVSEMSSRYNTFAEFHVRNLKEYNHKVKNMRLSEGDERPPLLPQIVIIVDELADLMMVAPGDVEDAICRLAQLARAAGIHLVIATQRPSVNVITGLIKANMPSRIAFAVSSGVDSRTILDMNGAEKLLGKGDMLFYPQGYPKPVRLQGSFVSDDEVSAVVEFLTRKNPEMSYDPSIQKQMESAQPGGSFGTPSGDERDSYFAEAGKLIIEKDKASIGMLQRMFKIGFNRAARVMDQLCDAGVVGPEEGTKPRKVLMTMEQFENYLEENA